MNIKDTFIRYMEEAIGHENALVAFSAFDEPASTAVRYNPFKECVRMEGKAVPWCAHGSILPHPIPVSRKEPAKIRFGSYLSAKGPRITAPRDIPIYSTDMAYPEITELSGWV